MDPGADPAMGMGMGMEGLDEEELPVLAGAARPWLSTTGILALLTVFLIALVGIVIFSLYLYFLQAKLECPECKAADVAKFTKKKATTTTTSTEPVLRQVEAPQKMSRQHRRRYRYRDQYRLRRLRSLLLLPMRPYYRARLHAWIWRSLRVQATLRRRALKRRRRHPWRPLLLRRQRRRLRIKGSWASVRLRRKRPNRRRKRKHRLKLLRSLRLLPRAWQ